MLPLNGTVLVTELSGSESSAHFQMGEDGWVSLAHGVHPYEVGEESQVFHGSGKAFYFDLTEGALPDVPPIRMNRLSLPLASARRKAGGSL